MDIVFITGDAYVDHPSFAMALLGRLLESAGYRIAILSQPDWHTAESFRIFGRPRLFFAVSAGNMDSMINHYTANKKLRNDDAYSPGGHIGLRPDRATVVYCQRAREAFPGVTIVAGGIEASLRRISHYDYWSNSVRRSIILDAKADILGFGMGERCLLEIAERLAAGEKVRDLRNIRGVAYRLGASESAPVDKNTLVLPSHEQVSSDPFAFARMTRISHCENRPLNARKLVQSAGKEKVVLNPPALPLTEAEMDWIYSLPYTRRPHPSYGDQRIPAFEIVKNSLQIMRGCFGGCTFCSITAHEGRTIQSRSQNNILQELQRLTDNPAFNGVVSDIGGPTANTYKMGCKKPEIEKKCRRQSCLYPSICKILRTDHQPLIELMRKARRIPKIRKVLVASGIRMDLAEKNPEYLKELFMYHVGGQLKVAPEHTDSRVLALMKKPSPESFIRFRKEFDRITKLSKKRQYLIPYFITNHPGSDINAMIHLAIFLKTNGYRPDKVQDFIPSPFDISTCTYYSGYDPLTMRPIKSDKSPRERRLQRALIQFYKPENWHDVYTALEKAHRTDLIGNGKDCLIPATPPRKKGKPKPKHKNPSGKDNHTVKPLGEASPSGYRPGRKTAHRRIRSR